MHYRLLLPLLAPFFTVVITLLLSQSRRAQRSASVAGALAHFAAGLALLGWVARGGIQVTQVGGWPAPFGITLAADLLSAIMVALTGLIGLAVAVYSLGSIDERREHFGYYPLLHVLLLGVTGAFLTGDMFNLYVWFEVMLIASFVLMALGGQQAQLEGALKYVTINLLSSAVFLTSLGILYSSTGTLNMADVARQVADGSVAPGLATVLAMMFLVAFGIKAALFPLYFWLPASYHTPPVAVTALFSGLLTKVGVYALIRIFTLIFTHNPDLTRPLLLGIASLTMISGALGALAQVEIRRLLSYIIIAESGYLLLGLALGSELALGAAVYFMAHAIIGTAALFLVAGIIARTSGSYFLAHLGGLYRADPRLATLFFIPAMAMGSLPPLPGFWGKLGLIRAGLALEEYVAVAVALGVSVLLLLAMVRIWAEAFWKPRPAEAPAHIALGRGQRVLLLMPTLALVVLVIVLGFAAEPFMALALDAARQLLDPAGYLQAVLGGAP